MAININTGTKIVWHYYWVNLAVVLITIIPILILRILQIRIIKEIPAITKATIATVYIKDWSWPITLIFILPLALIKHTTPNAIIAPKYSTIVDMTKQPPQALIKNNNIKERIKVIKIVESEIGHVCNKSAIDWS